MSKKAARRRGKHVTYYANMQGELVDYSPDNPQDGMPYHLQYREWEEKYQDKLYLVEDLGWKPPPVIVPSKESIAKIKAALKGKRAEEKQVEEAKPEASKEREAAFRSVVRRVARWEGSGAEEDRLEARRYAEFAAELYPDLKDEILAEFARAAEAMK